MAKNKKRHLFRKFIFLLIIIAVLYLVYNLITNIFFDGESIINIPIIDKKEGLSFDIVDSSESDNDVIDTIFMEGMSESDFKKVLEYKPTLVKSDDEYHEVSYNFENKLHYYELEEIYRELNNSSIVNLYVIGKSVDNRNIYGIEVGNGKDVLFMDANIHAAEVSTTLVLTKFLTDIVNDYEIGDESVKSLLNDVKIASILCINPDGYEIYNYGVESLNNKNVWVYENKDNINFENIKSNVNGVDLNRNFPTQNEGLYYKGYKLKSNTSLVKTFEKGKYYNGEIGGSEPEIKAAMYFMLKHFKNTYAYINLHSQGRVIYAGKPNLSDEFNELSNSFAKRISSINGYKVHGLSSEPVGEGNDGSATDFMAELANGFKYSSKTGRLTTDKYVDNSCKLEYKFPVITMEITKTWTSDPQNFSNEYYNIGLKKVFCEILKKN